MTNKDNLTGLQLLKPKRDLVAYWKQYRYDASTTARAFLWMQVRDSLREPQLELYNFIRDNPSVTTQDIATELDLTVRSVSQTLANLESYCLARKHAGPQGPEWIALDFSDFNIEDLEDGE